MVGIDLANFWDDSDYAKKAYFCGTFTDEDVAAVETVLGYKLPESYLQLMRTHNGGMPKHCQIPIPLSPEYSYEVEGILGIGDGKRCELGDISDTRYYIEDWEYPDIGIAVCSCPSGGHDMFFLDYRECGPRGEPRVVHVDNELGNKITVVAENFEQFLKMLH